MSEKTLLDETKTLLRAVLVSSTDALTIDELNRDYKKQEGRNIPYASLGYPDLKSFLLSITDAVTWNPHSKKFTAFVAADANNAHVHKLVSEQRRNSSRRSNNLKPLSASTHSYRQQPQQLQSYPINHPLHAFSQQSVNNMYKQSMNRSFQPSPGNLLAPPNTLYASLFQSNQQHPILGRSVIPPLLPNFSIRGDSYNYHNTTNRSKSTARHMNGRNKQSNNRLAKDESNLEAKSNVHMSCDVQSDSNSEINALPPIDDDDPIRFIGTESMNNKYGRRIPPAILSTTLKTGDIQQICVTEVATFPHFYFQFHHGEDHMRGIQENLNLFYGDCSSQHKMRPTQIQIGNVCAAFLANKWSRAEIISKSEKGDRLKLLFVDYGTIDYVPIDCVCHLPTEVCEYPRLCHRGTLAFVDALLDQAVERDIVKIFCDLVTDRSLIAVVSSVDENKNISLTLVDTSQPDTDVIVNQVLMERIWRVG